MHSTFRKSAIAVASLAATGALLAGCGSDNPVDAAKDAAGNVTNAAKDAGDAVKDAAGDVTSGAKKAAGDVTSAAKDAGHKAENGAGDVKNELDKVPDAQIQGPDGPITVKKPIAEKYQALGGADGLLGEPDGDQQEAPHHGYYVDFNGGEAAIYFSASTKAHEVHGAIKQAWLADGGVKKLGYPTSDEHDIDNGRQSNFQNGHITFIDGQTNIVKTN